MNLVVIMRKLHHQDVRQTLQYLIVYCTFDAAQLKEAAIEVWKGERLRSPNL